MIGISSAIILIAVCMESFILPIPLTLLIIIFLSIYQRKPFLFILVIFAGFLIDSLTFRLLGVSSLFFVCLVALIFLYGRKFETNHFFFIFFATVFASSLYESIFSPTHILLNTFFLSILCAISFLILTLMQKKLISSKE